MVTNKIKVLIAFSVFLGSTSFAYSQHIPEQDLKKNVLPVLNGLAYVQKLEPKMYQYDTRKFNKLKLPSGQQYGFMAEEVQRVLPELVNSESQSYMVGKNTYRSTTIKNTDLESLIPLLVAAIKEQQQQIDELKRQLDSAQK